MADTGTRFGALKQLRSQPARTTEPDEPLEPERPHTAGVGESGETKRGQGRPGGGKRSNPDYERLNLLVRKTTRRKVDMKMLQEPNPPKDLSELVDKLLASWAE
jgi:hypothetical protein